VTCALECVSGLRPQSALPVRAAWVDVGVDCGVDCGVRTCVSEWTWASISSTRQRVKSSVCQGPE